MNAPTVNTATTDTGIEEADLDAVETGHLANRAAFTMVGDWVVLSGVSHKAVRLYCLLAMHLNASRGDRMVWPSRATLATMMGLSDPKSVDAPMRELITIGAVQVIRRRYRGRKDFAPNRYIVYEAPPATYKGYASCADFYAQRRTLLETDTINEPQVNGNTQGVAEVSPLPLQEPLGEEPGGRGETSPRGGGKNAPTNKMNVNKNSLPPSEGESRARGAHPREDAHTREEDPQPALIEPDEPQLTDTKIQMGAAAGRARDGRVAANDLGKRWHELCEERGTPFPASAPGARFTKFAEFVQMLAPVLVNYSPDEVWEALVALYERRSVVFPSRRELERELAVARRGLRSVPGSAGVGVEAVAPQFVELADLALRWWMVEQGQFVPSNRQPELRALLADAFAQGASKADVANALRACGQAGKACPQDWLFANVLGAIRADSPPDVVLMAAGVRLSSSEVRQVRQEASREDVEARNRAIVEAVCAGRTEDVLRWQREGGAGLVPPSDGVASDAPPNGKIIIGGVA